MRSCAGRVPSRRGARTYWFPTSCSMIRCLEHFGNAFLRGAVPFAASGASVLVLDLVAAFFQLAHGQENALQNIERLEAGDHDGDPVTLRDRKIFFIAHDGANVARGQESLDDAVLR